MKQRQELKSTTKTTDLQIKILREIALNGKQTIPDLIKKLGVPYTTIHTVFSRDETKDKAIRLFRRNGIIPKNVEVTLYSLTSYGIITLLHLHYERNVDNAEKRLAGKPYLNLDEFNRFISIFEIEHSYREGTISYQLNEYAWIYFESNPTTTKQLISKYKDDPKLKQLVLSIEDIDSKRQQLKVKKEEYQDSLSSLLISSLKK